MKLAYLAILSIVCLTSCHLLRKDQWPIKQVMHDACDEIIDDSLNEQPDADSVHDKLSKRGHKRGFEGRPKRYSGNFS
jgi:hypothetical protein